MKKIGRLRLDELKEHVDILTAEEQQSFVGGANGDVWRISGGYLYDVGSGTLFCGDDDKFAWFPGVGLSTSFTYPNSAYYHNGTIHVDEGWLANNFDVFDFAHEFGHYLQEINMSTWDYYTEVVIPSFYTATTKDPYEHSQTPHEQDATYRGYSFLYDQWYYDEEDDN